MIEIPWWEKRVAPHFPYPQCPHTWVCHMESSLHLSIYVAAATYSNFITFLLNFQQICDLPLGPYTPLFHRMNKFSGHIQTLLKAQNLKKISKTNNKQADSVCVIKKKTQKIRVSTLSENNFCKVSLTHYWRVNLIQAV